MTDIVMSQEGSDTLSVKELNVALPRYQEEFDGSGSSSNYAGVCEPPTHPQEQQEAEAEFKNLHLPTTCEEDLKISPPLNAHEYYPEYYPVIKDMPPDELERCMIEFRELKAAAAAAAAALPPDQQPVPVHELTSPSFFDCVPPSLIEYRRCGTLVYTPCLVTYTPDPPGDYDYYRHVNPRPRLFAEVALHCYNLEKGTHFERLGLPPRSYDETLEARDPVSNYTCKFETNVRLAAENINCFHVITTRCRPLPSTPPPPGEDGLFQCGFDTLCVDELFKGNLPDWLPDDYATSTTLLMQYYEMKESEVEEQAKEWLHLYAELALFIEMRHRPDKFNESRPLELGKVIVQTRGAFDSMKLDNAVFFITFKTSGGDVCKGIIRRTRDGIPEHLSLEAKCFM